MISKNNAATNAKAKVIVFDQKEESKIVRDSANKIKDVSKLLNESKFRIIKSVPSSYDEDGCRMLNVLPSEKRQYILVECAFDDDPRAEINMKRFLAYLKSNSYNVVTSEFYTDRDYPTCKAIIKID